MLRDVDVVGRARSKYLRDCPHQRTFHESQKVVKDGDANDVGYHRGGGVGRVWEDAVARDWNTTRNFVVCHWR